MQVGDRVRFIRSNSNGGGRYGRVGEIGIIIRVRENSFDFKFEDITRQREAGFHPSAFNRDVEPVRPEPEVEKAEQVLYLLFYYDTNSQAYVVKGGKSAEGARQKEAQYSDHPNLVLVDKKKIKLNIKKYNEDAN